MSTPDSILSDLQDGRRRFLALVENVRPELHRYCARMVGSITDGEDIVQDTLARAYYELSEHKELPPLRPWLFRIAHNRALDYLRRYERRMSEPLEAAMEIASAEPANPDNALARDQAMRAAISRFLELPPLPRTCVILKDVLDHSLEEIAETLDITLPAAKSGLHRGRARLRELAEAPGPEARSRTVSEALTRYAALFNARDWDGIRTMLVDDVKLDLVTRVKARGAYVRNYFINYDAVQNWRVEPGLLDGREMLAMYNNAQDNHPSYFVELTFVDDRIVNIRDFRFVSYIAHEAVFERSG
ncbi:MAG: RNA polymerase sigma factor [Sulfurifustaceae bacterium]